MKISVITVKLAFSAVFFWAGGSSTAAPFLAFGDLRGHLEPCGCDPRTDVGGLRRLAGAVARYRLLPQQPILLNTGNVMVPQSSETATSIAINKTLRELRPEASLINQYEWQRLTRGQNLADVDWVLSNYSGHQSLKSFKSVIKIGDTEVFGFLGLRDVHLAGAGTPLLASWKKTTKTSSPDSRVLLFSGSNADLKVMAATGFFGTIIRSNTAALGAEVGDREQHNEGMLVTAISGRRVIWSVPFGGTGLLRLGGLETSPVPEPLEKILSLSSGNLGLLASPVPLSPKNSSEAMKLDLSSVKVLHWLKPGEENGASESINRIFEEARSSEKNQFKLLAAAREKDLPSSAFIGAEACAGCHQSSYEVWKKSKHATAMAVLIDKSRHEDATCVECHVLGFTAKGGYVNQEKSPHFSNVQCENCHGPRRDHVLNPGNNKKSKNHTNPNSSCAECHTPPHSPGFEQNKYWDLIKHK